MRRAPLAPALVKELRKDFRDRIRMVQSVDDMVARVLSTLTDAEKRNTYVVFTSDNGFHLGQHRLVRGKSTAHDHEVRVPPLVKRPTAGRHGYLVTGAIAQHVDLFATFLDMAEDGADRARQAQPGRAGRAGPGRRAPSGGDSQPPSYAEVRTAGELYVVYEGEARPEYYDTVANPNQESNDPGNARTSDLGRVLDAPAGCGKPGAPDCWTAARL
ncbi:sulfatase-like hydrolase/transferase [Nonomuraea sp. CA-141351]|uniref:sulfatase-like hydrolase/transferase n=1 Tax=Nonomuraea sp. CA-141351 TaxID=3239996 RepID=UPI003D8DA3DE